MGQKHSKRHSSKYPPSFSKKDAASFIRHFDQVEPRMEQIIYELQMISADKINIKNESKAATMVGAVLMGIGAGLTRAAALFTGAGGLTIAEGAIKEKTMLEECRRKVDKLTTEFRTIVASLRIVLTNLKTVCGEPRTFSATDSLTDVIDEYKMVWEEFKRVKVELQTHLTVQRI